MGRRKKTALNLPAGSLVPVAKATSGEVDSAKLLAVDEQQQQDPYMIPLHSRQAAFAILWLLVYSFAMFTLPFGAFYGVAYVLSEHYQIEGFHNTCGSVLAAVLTVNFIIMLYAFRGFREAEEEDRERAKHKAS
ncbi:uncharacterized protein LOC128728705 [Anopheles nili]|uniref:uncharacterized protein LOC128728705 n=1 Tax=Anopheles nili TaxID=185578 RepID=UPI00237BA8B2|nr:uncharacterized protein LOC128728705 [Anopheles nili]